MSIGPLQMRILTSVAMAAAVIVFLFTASHPVALFVLAGLALVCAWEWSRFVSADNGPRIVYVISMGLVVAACWLKLDEPIFIRFVLLIAGAWWVIASAWVLAAPTQWLNPVFAAVVGYLTIVPLWLAASHLQTSSEYGPWWFLFFVVLIAAADTGAYFTGRAIGRRPLAPAVSPKKTWEGVGGGLLASAVLAGIGSVWLGVPARLFVPMSILVMLFSVVGDLNVSRFKRHVGIKDSGRWLPGHGGILDRVDSMTAAIPLFLLGTYLSLGRL